MTVSSSVISLVDTEPELAAEMCAGNREAFGKIYTRYAPTLLGCILKLVTDKKDAETILQHSFIEIWNNRQDFNGAGLFVWMLRIAKVTALSFINERQKTINSEIQKPVPIVDINDIPDKNRAYSIEKAVLELLYFNNYSLKEASGILKIKEPEIKKMLRSALNNLKNLAR